MTTSHKKRLAYGLWKNGEAIPEIATQLSVAEKTVEVYIIDLLASGEGTDPERKTMLRHMEVNSTDFHRVESHLCKSGITLREIKDATLNLTYNQIRVVIACLLNNTII